MIEIMNTEQLLREEERLNAALAEADDYLIIYGLVKKLDAVRRRLVKLSSQSEKTGAMEKFSVEYQYKLFLKRIALQESKMHPVQREQIKMTFYGAVGQLLIFLRDNLTEFPEEQGSQILDKMLKEIEVFFEIKAGRND